MQHLSGGIDLRNLLLTLCYDGRRFHGWQIQQNAYTVQEALQTALSQIIGDGFDVKGCSRTDSGVHANMYCVSLKTAHPIPCVRLKAALNRWLPLSVAVTDCVEVGADFHARYSCKSKEYIYKIWNSEVRSPFLEGYALHYRYPLDAALLNEAAQAYVGRHDFTSFCTLDNREQGDMTRDVKLFSVTRDGDMVTGGRLSVQYGADHGGYPAADRAGKNPARRHSRHPGEKGQEIRGSHREGVRAVPEPGLL